MTSESRTKPTFGPDGKTCPFADSFGAQFRIGHSSNAVGVDEVTKEVTRRHRPTDYLRLRRKPWIDRSSSRTRHPRLTGIEVYARLLQVSHNARAQMTAKSSATCVPPARVSAFLTSPGITAVGSSGVDSH